MFKNLIIFILTASGIIFSASETVISKGGLGISDGPGAFFKTEEVAIDGSIYKKLVLPEDYSPSIDFPATETFERIYTFAVPDGAVPSFSFTSSGIRNFSTAELVPSRSFIPGPDGMSAEAYILPEERTDNEREHAEIVRFGH
ncbi:MAG: hypothetical protein WC212_07740, partial [Candidatus Delongbacteria bacterium]